MLYVFSFFTISSEDKFQLFPLPIAEIISATQANEFHFSLTKGNWLYEKWGYPSRPSPPGAQLWAKFVPYNKDNDKSWDLLVKALSGKFCASLTSIDHKTTSHPKLSFQPIDHSTNEPIYYSNIADESLCTENLTPWKKLLPCFSKSGLSTLLNSGNLFKSTYSSLAIDVVPNCLDDKCSHTNFKVSQTMTVVFNAVRLFEGMNSWSLIKLFGSPLTKICPVAQSSRIYIEDTNRTQLGAYTIFPNNQPNKRINLGERKFTQFDVQSIIEESKKSNKSTTNVGQRFNNPFKHSDLKKPSVEFSTHVAGVGLSSGTIIGIIKNNDDKPITITYFDILPSYLRVYLHTLKIRTRSGLLLQYENLQYTPSHDRGRPASIEFKLSIPSNTVVDISMDFERAFLSWTEYRPDANRGVLLSSAVINIIVPKSSEQLFISPHVLQNMSIIESISDNISLEDSYVLVRLYARPLLVVLPTPDFSMPYNVICLVSTVMATAFGPLHALTSKKPKIDK